MLSLVHGSETEGLNLSGMTDDELDVADVVWTTAFTPITITFSSSTTIATANLGPMGEIADEIKVPDYVEPLTAYRAWIYNRTNKIFRSTYIDFIWERDTVYQAKCFNHKCGCYTIALTNYLDQPIPEETSVPHTSGVCGFYSLKKYDPDTIAACVGISSSHLVIGEVEIWGKIVEHTHGYRSEFARMNKIKWAGDWSYYKGKM